MQIVEFSVIIVLFLILWVNYKKYKNNKIVKYLVIIFYVLIFIYIFKDFRLSPSPNSVKNLLNEKLKPYDIVIDEIMLNPNESERDGIWFRESKFVKYYQISLSAKLHSTVPVNFDCYSIGSHINSIINNSEMADKQSPEILNSKNEKTLLNCTTQIGWIHIYSPLLMPISIKKINF